MQEGPSVSLRGLAAGAGVSVPTLQHYFGDRAGALRAVLVEMHALGMRHIEQAATELHGPPQVSLRWYLEELVRVWSVYGVGPMIAMGLSVGLSVPGTGPATVDALLEPVLQAAERRLAMHIAAGELPMCEVRLAALQLVSPVLLALLHQHSLGGRACRPLDLQVVVDDVLRQFFAADRSGPAELAGA